MYSDKFTKFKEEAISHCTTIGNTIWTKELSTNEKEIQVNSWICCMCDIYNIDVEDRPHFKLDTTNHGEQMYYLTGGGDYNPTLNRITLYKKLSYVTLLHEFRHAMQHLVPDLKTINRTLEDDARGWSMSMFKKTHPEKWQRAIERGIVHFV